MHEKRVGGERGGRKEKRGVWGEEKKGRGGIGQEVKGTMYRPLHRTPTGRIEGVSYQRAYRTANKRTGNTQ